MQCGLGGVLGGVSVLGVSLVTAAGQPALELQTALSPGWHTCGRPGAWVAQQGPWGRLASAL